MNCDSSQCAASRTLLIVDDQHAVRISLGFLLEGAGYRVLFADSGRAALALAETEVFDGAIIDIHMPGLNGLETCLALHAKVAARGRTPHVWFMTGAHTSALDRRCAEMGALGVFRKPFEFPDFLRRLETGFSSPAPSPTPLPAPSCVVADDENRPHRL